MKHGNAAFPRPMGQDGRVYSESQIGMTMRQWYKGMALQGVLSSLVDGTKPEPLVAYAASLADAMVEEDEKSKGV